MFTVDITGSGDILGAVGTSLGLWGHPRGCGDSLLPPQSRGSPEQPGLEHPGQDSAPRAGPLPVSLLGCPGPTSTTTAEGESAHFAPLQRALGTPAERDGQTERSTPASHGNWGAETGSPEVQEQSKGVTWLLGGASLPSCPALRGEQPPMGSDGLSPPRGLCWGHLPAASSGPSR